MNRLNVCPPTFCFPKKDPEHYCECQDRPVELTHKTGIVFWQKAVGDPVLEGETLAEAEVEKKTVELPSPAAGRVAEICVDEGEEFSFGDVLCIIETDMEG